MTRERSAPPVAAATVILTRPAPAGSHPWECFMIRRPVGSEFAADVYVFPGGKVDSADADPGLVPFCRTHPGVQIEGEAQHSAWRMLRVAAIRELFEEIGVLIATRGESVVRVDGRDADRFAAYRREVHAGRLTMRELAEREGLTYPLDGLHAIARWITPETLPRRFDTLFLVAMLPDGQEPDAHAHETVEGLWIAPAEALRRFHAGDFPLVFATERNLAHLAGHGSVEGLIASASTASLDPVIPRMIVEGSTRRFVVPGDPDW